jgi:hypothetical protein
VPVTSSAIQDCERPILFSGEMVRANLRPVDPKTQTRRVMKIGPREQDYSACRATYVDSAGFLSGIPIDIAMHSPWVWLQDESGKKISCPYGKPGDRLWVRETWASPETNLKLPGRIAYNADGEAGAFLGDGGGEYIWLHHGRIIDAEGYTECFPKNGTNTYGLKKFGGRWRPSIHMPRWASRLALEIKSVRVERVQELSEADALAEGIVVGYAPDGSVQQEPTDAYRKLWDSINAKREGGIYAWARNPWVWVIEYKRLEANA